MRPAFSSAARLVAGGELLRMRPAAPANRHLEKAFQRENRSPGIGPPTKNYGFRGMKFRKILPNALGLPDSVDVFARAISLER